MNSEQSPLVFAVMRVRDGIMHWCLGSMGWDTRELRWIEAYDSYSLAKQMSD